MTNENQENSRGMVISADGISFNSLIDFGIFLREFNLFGIAMLAEPIQDNAGKVLFKEQQYFKETIYNKLEDLEGQYKPAFKVVLNDSLLKSIRKALGGKILNRLEAPENSFIEELYQGTMHRFRDYVLNAFVGSRSMTMTLFKISRERRQFFNHLADMGLLSLGVTIQRGYRLKNINRYAFLGGILLDLPFASSGAYQKYPDNENQRTRMATQAADVATRLKLPGELSDAILNHPVLPSLPPVSRDVKLEPDLVIPEQNMYEHILEEDDSSLFEDGTPRKDYNEQLANLLTEILKITRYIQFVTGKVEDKAHFAEELVYMIAYNTARGYFHNDLINPILKKFRRFEEKVRRLMRIAEIEGMCKFPPSAWAYPKPLSSQVLCKENRTDCPHFETGWEIQVVSPQEALGWIGASLPEGYYAKCSLEQLLENEMDFSKKEPES